MDTYSDLKTRVTTLMARSDAASHIQDWVSESERYVVNELRVREMIKVDSTLTPTSGVLTPPSDFAAVEELRLADNLDVWLRNTSPRELFKYEDTSFGSGYGYWAEIGTSIYIRPTPSDSQTYWLSYFARPTALTEDTQETNDIFPKYSDVYLAGALWKGFAHYRNFEVADRYLNECKGLIASYNQKYVEEIDGGAVLTIPAAMYV